MRMPFIATVMALAFIAIAAIAFWDEERESASALDDFAAEQATLARAVALQATPWLQGPDHSMLFRTLAQLEVRGQMRVFVVLPGETQLRAMSGAPVGNGPLLAAMQQGASSVRLQKTEVASLELPPRMAVAGVAPVVTSSGQSWVFAVVATAERERDREFRARWRLILAVTLAAGLVLAFGGLALRQQRDELKLEQTLMLEKLSHEADARLEKESRSVTMLTLATGVAHEVSTPLNVIVGRAEGLLTRVADDEKATKSVRSILEQAESVNQVVRALLRLARGDLPATAPIDPSVVAQRAQRLVEHRFAQANVGLSVEVPEGLPPIHGDRLLLEHAVTNLLLNACDACGHGGRVVVSAHTDASSVVIEVRDDGVGISPSDAERAVEPFFTTKPVGQGTGLGLALVNEIVKAHRGVFALTAERTRGTLATIRLPLGAHA